jgi:outer membrane protein OmpA-like peptidoglycan-associated protein
VRPTPRTARGLATATCLLLGVSGCTFGTQPHATSHETVTEPVVPSALVAVVSGPAAAPSLAGLVADTTRPGEHLDVLGSDPAAIVLAAASPPPPARVVVSGRPAAPGPGSTPYQQAKYHQSLARWQHDILSAKEAVASQTRSVLVTWAKSLNIARKVSRLPGPASDLASECAIAVGVLADLDQTVGASFGGRRVVLLYSPNLDGSLPTGELTGDDVIVVTSFLPSAAAVSAAQTRLLTAGAARASILGPEFTAAQLSHLVTQGLSQKTVTETLSGTALFTNNSARLGPGAVRILMPLIGPLRKAGAAAVINGYASTPGSREKNYLLSYSRAAAVAAFLEAHGIPASSLAIIGHGSNDLVAAGPSGANRRVVVVIEDPATG